MRKCRHNGRKVRFNEIDKEGNLIWRYSCLECGDVYRVVNKGSYDKYIEKKLNKGG